MSAPGICVACGNPQEDLGLCCDCRDELLAAERARWAAEDRLDDMRFDITSGRD